MSDAAGRKSRRPWKRFVLPAVVSVAVLLYLCYKTGAKITVVMNKVFEGDPLVIAGVFLLSGLIHILIGAHKWYLILRAMGCETTYGEVLFVRMGSDPVRFVAPFKTGELANIAYFWRHGKLSFARSASWVLFDKALNIAGTFFWLLVGVPIYLMAYQTQAVSWKVLAMGTGLVLMAALGGLLPLLSARVRRLLLAVAQRLHRKLGHVAAQLLSTFEEISPGRKAFLLAYGALFQLRPLLVLYFLMQAYSLDFDVMPSIAAVLALGSVVVVCGNVPYTQLGLGTREAALYALFHSYLLPVASQGETLYAIGILMVVAMQAVPAVMGMPLLGSFLGTLETGQEPQEFIETTDVPPLDDTTEAES